MPSLFPFIGFNFAFWVLVGLVRFISERAFTILGVARTAFLLKAFAEKHFSYIEKTFGATGAVLGGAGAFLAFVLFYSATGILDGTTSASSASVYSSIVAWMFFALIAGYMAARIETLRPLRSAVYAGVFYFIFRVVIIIASSGIPYLNLGIAFAALSFLLGLALFFSFLGGIVGGHFNTEDRRREARLTAMRLERIIPAEVAAIVPARNEEKSIAKTILSLKKVMAPENIYIGSDASTDKTVEIARALGVNVFDIQPNRGKANVLAYLIDENKLCDRYKAVMIVDADTEIAPDYLEKALPLFDDTDIVAVAVHAVAKLEGVHRLNTAGLIHSYRVRFYRIFQATIRYAQTWKYLNTTPIVPGFASIYRTTALRHISVNTPGLAIEDFNMTFELYHKKLGKVAYSPDVRGVAVDPLTLKDYYKQMKRWNLGLWQTIFHHGVWPSLFSTSLVAFLIELFFASIFTMLLPFLILALFIVPGNAIHAPLILGFSFFDVTLFGVAIFFIFDYLMTVLVALYEKKSILLLDGFAFFILRYIDAFTFLYTLPLALLTKSDGKWESPKR